jgi:hypothetical protein
MNSNTVKLTLFALDGVASVGLYLLCPKVSTLFIIVGVSGVLGLIIRLLLQIIDLISKED